MTETQNTQPTEFEDMEEPELCPACDLYFDAALAENFETSPFRLICGHCQQYIYNDPEIKWQER